MFKLRFKKILIMINIFIIIFNCSNVFGLRSDAIDAGAYADIMMSKGLGDNIGSALLDGGYFGETSLGYTGEDFRYTYHKNGHFYLIKDTNRFKSDDGYIQGMHDLYVNIVNQLKEQPEMKYILKEYNTYAGINDDEYARSAIERIAMEVMAKKIDEVKKAYKKGCNDKAAGKFMYNGKEYKCSEIAYHYNGYTKRYSYEYLENANKNLSYVADADMEIWGMNVSDTLTDGIYENNKEVTGKDTRPNSTNGGSYKWNGTFSFFYNATYFPRLTNAIGFANRLSNAGELEGLSGYGYKGGSVKVALDEMITDFSKLGVYILYGAILFFGVKSIWSGINGKVEFKETLPYILLSIVLFYLAPNLVELLQQIFGNEYGENYLSNIWGSVVKIVQISAFAGILFTGVKLIFSSADAKADLKKSLIPILIGSILVFASSMVVSIILSTTKDIGIASLNDNNIIYKNIIEKV